MASTVGWIFSLPSPSLSLSLRGSAPRHLSCHFGQIELGGGRPLTSPLPFCLFLNFFRRQRYRSTGTSPSLSLSVRSLTILSREKYAITRDFRKYQARFHRRNLQTVSLQRNRRPSFFRYDSPRGFLNLAFYDC